MGRKKNAKVGGKISNKAEIISNQDGGVGQFVNEVRREFNLEAVIYAKDNGDKYTVRDLLQPLIELHNKLARSKSEGFDRLALCPIWENEYSRYVTNEFRIKENVRMLSCRPTPKFGWQEIDQIR